ncbi:hypothetical protein THOM_1537 [Trachipleistophora hominis]|uniref:Uncharacterized protein n=1 Tax=Trachipleistophora hominis TaxID=72359 RepID=L7JXL2_TRAHO|nr:hypothetical protein THOM_1537 [Trachipleistophora hominis]
MNDMGMYFIVNQLFILCSISCSEEYVGEYNQAAIKYFLEETEDFVVTNNEDSRIIEYLINELTGLLTSMRTILGECKNLDSILAGNDGKDGRNTGYKNLKSFFDIVCLEDVLGTKLTCL